MTGYTPGPWIAFKGAGWCVKRPNAKRCIKVGMTPDCDLIDGETEAEAEANARLIAAAPLMYEALKEADAFLRSNGIGRKIVSDAIAACEGEEK